MFGESDEDVEMRIIEYFLNHVESSEQQEGSMIEASSEAKRSHDFKFDMFCMFSGVIQDDGQFYDISTEKKEGRKNLNYVLKEDDTISSHEESHT